MVREREVSPVELVETHLRQIELENPRINAFVAVMAEEALAAAKRAEAEVMHEACLGLLHGVPVTIKDSF
ncbi:MAG: amidase family protein, partial [Acidobacteria bacterium]|nr:amidase family protein [Acidobacteriota bacterium]